MLAIQSQKKIGQMLKERRPSSSIKLSPVGYK